MSAGSWTVEDWHGRLARHKPQQVHAPTARYAAVALILADSPKGTEILLIERAERPGDPWSGHMAFPGGHKDEAETDLLETAVRETLEEVGLDLRLHGQIVGALDDLRAVSDRPVDLVIRPYVCRIEGRPPLQPDEKEVRNAVWVPLPALSRGQHDGWHSWEIGGETHRYPAFIYRGFTIWGLTYRMLTSLLDLAK